METPSTDDPAEVVRDDLLRLVFTCCHPFLSLDAQVALALRTLGGLSTAEVARGLLVPEATMAKRLTRAKQKIAGAGIPYRVPAAEELPDRLDGVATTVYLIFNEGYAGPGRVGRGGLRLGRVLAELMPDEPTVLGLLALMLLQESRRAARRSDGVPVLLADQDRTRWDARAIKEGVELVGVALRGRRGPEPVCRAGRDRRLSRPGAVVRGDQLGCRHLLVRRAADRARHAGGAAEPGRRRRGTGRPGGGIGAGGRHCRPGVVPVVARQPGRAAEPAGFPGGWRGLGPRGGDGPAGRPRGSPAPAVESTVDSVAGGCFPYRPVKNRGLDRGPDGRVR